jgi:hypothetical protein
MKFTTNPPTTYTVELTVEELERIWFLSYRHEGGDGMPKSDAQRLHGMIYNAIPTIADSAEARFVR